MRDVIFFIASLAGATILTALAIILRPESPYWKFLLWGGISVFVACACVLALHHFRPDGKPLFLTGVGSGAAILVGFSIAFFFAEADRQNPLVIGSILRPFDYAPGTRISGISWKKGFSHLELLFRNRSDENILDLSVTIQPEYPIAKSAAASEFATCRIGAPMAMPSPTIIAKTVDGKQIFMAAEDSDLNENIHSSHRLYCEKLSAHTDINVVLATVVMPSVDAVGSLYGGERRDPTFIDLAVSYQIGGEKHDDPPFRIFLHKSEVPK
jgi:hypothetical protein